MNFWHLGLSAIQLIPSKFLFYSTASDRFLAIITWQVCRANDGPFYSFRLVPSDMIVNFSHSSFNVNDNNASIKSEQVPKRVLFLSKSQSFRIVSQDYQIGCKYDSQFILGSEKPFRILVFMITKIFLF